MDRRRFTQMAGGGLLSAPMLLRGVPAPAATGAAKEENRDSNLPDLISQLFYQGTSNRIILTGLILLSTTRIWAANVAQGAPQFDEDRVSSSRILGGLGGLARPTIEERVASAQVIGTVVLLQTTLIGLVSPQIQQLTAARYSALVAHRLLSWQVSRMAASNAISGLPGLNDLRLLQTIGTLYLVRDVIMMILPPPSYG